MSRETLDDDAITRVDRDTPLPETATSQIVGATISMLHGSESGRLHYVDESGVVMGRADEAELVFSDATISRAHARLDLQKGHFYLRDLESMNGTYVDDKRLWGVMRLPSSCRVRLGRRTVFQFTAVDQLGADSFLQLRHALFIDPLTGTGNRSFLEQRLREELSFGWRHREPVAVLLIDLDHFKNINDRFGHVSGDHVLRGVGAILRDTVRTEDSVYRFGGEEFWPS
jgi:two-component system, cell cycle response regulator